MSGFNLLLFLTVIFTNYLNGNALIGESIITTNEAYAGQFPYQAAIMGKPNGSDESTLQGSAVIISDYHLLGAAQSFIDEDGKHKELTFSAVVNEINVKNENIVLRDIVRFYLPTSGSFINNDISVSRLRYSLNLRIKPSLSKAYIPRRHPGADSPLGTVSGYGYHWAESLYERDADGLLEKVGIQGATDGKLRYESVGVLSTRNCVDRRRRATGTYFCGGMEPAPSDSPRRGFCVLDHGSPLVIKERNKHIVVGVASTHQKFCENESLGGLYTNVASNYYFINGVLRNETSSGTLAYDNRPHNMNEPHDVGSSMSSLTLD